MRWIQCNTRTTTTSYRHVSASIRDDETGRNDVCDLGKAWVQRYDQSEEEREREREREKAERNKRVLVFAIVYWSLPHRGALSHPTRST